MTKYKPVKVFFNGERMKDVYPHATRFQVWKYRAAMWLRKWVIRTAIFGGATMGVFGFYTLNVTKAEIAYSRPEVPFIKVDAAEVPLIDQMPPMLKKIIMAESGGNQFCTEELAKAKKYEDCYAGRVGKPLMNVNADGTADIGIGQINDYHWGVKAKELGYNLDEEEGNLRMALWLFNNYGTQPWNASKEKWSKM